MSLDAPRFGRVITAMVTPFDEGGALDLDSAANLAAWLVDNGSDGLVLAGTTGESPVLSDSEEVALTRALQPGLGRGGPRRQRPADRGAGWRSAR